MNTHPTSSPVLRARNLGRHYGGRAALQALDLELAAGCVLGLIGPNGAGKSTAMQLLTGNLAPTSGTVEICGVDLARHPRKAKSHLGYLPEVAPLYRELTAREFLLLAARLHHVPRHATSATVTGTLERCGLAEVSNRLVGNLSKGYRQRLGIAQAIVHQPPLVILDEPTAGLDPLQLRAIHALILELGKDHAVLLSTHALVEAERLCDAVLILDGGRTVFGAKMAELRNGSETGGLEEAFLRAVESRNNGDAA